MQAQVAALQDKQDARTGAQTAPLAQLARQLGTELETLSSASEEHAYLEQERNQRGELSQIAEKHTSPHADQKDA